FCLQPRDEGIGIGDESLRKLAARTAHEFRGDIGMACLVGVEQLVPLVLAHGAGVAGTPAVADLLRDLEGRVRPAERLAGRSDLVLAQRGAVCGFLAGLVRRTETDGGAAAQ